MKQASIFLMALVCAFSCGKKSDDQSPLPRTNPYYQSANGNYWIYNTYKIDTVSGEEEFIKTDSVVVSGYKFINGKHYTVFSGTSPYYIQWHELETLRDSSGCLVDDQGVVKFSAANNIGDTLSTSYVIGGPESEPDTIIVFKWFMEGPPKRINVPAGSFTVLNGVQKVIKRFPGAPTNFSHCYAPGIGLVLSQSTYQNIIIDGTYMEQRLVRYHIDY